MEAKKVFINIPQSSKESNLYRSLFLIKLQRVVLQLYYKRTAFDSARKVSWSILKKYLGSYFEDQY